MPPQYFIMVTTQGSLGHGKVSMSSLAQARTRDIIKSVGLKVEHGNQIEYGQSRGQYKTVGDQEHLKIINDYFEGVSMSKIAKKLDRSAATVHTQVHSHNEDIDKLGYYAECRRLKGAHEAHRTGSREV